MTKQRIGPQPGPQEMAASSPADLIIYGGEAGGGKSWLEVFMHIRHKDNPKYGGVVFRRTAPELTGPESLWSIARELFVPLGARPVESPNLQMTFPSGAVVQFLHLQHESDVYAHQGKGYTLICVDEATHFTRQQLEYLFFSRGRSTSGIRPYGFWTCNPDPDSYVATLIAWWIDQETGYPIKERSGVLRWLVRQGDALLWGDTREEMLQHCTREGQEPVSVTFISAKLEDNRILLAKDPGYMGRIANLDEIDYERLRKGNWKVRPEGGKYYKTEHFAKRWANRNALPPMNVYGCSDFAVTEKRPGVTPDFTEHGVFGIAANGDIYVLDWDFMQETSDVWVDRMLDKASAHRPLAWFGEDGVIRRAVEPWLTTRMRERRIYLRMEWLKTSTSREERANAVGFEDPSKRAKAIRGRNAQALASAGRFIFPANEPWADRVISQLVGFPNGKDDAFDVIGHIGNAIVDAHPAFVAPASESPMRKDYVDVDSEADGWRHV